MPDLAPRRAGYLPVLTDTFREKYLYAKKAFEEFDLSDEMAAMRMLLGEILRRMEAEKELPVGDVVKVCKEIRQTMKQASEIADRASIPVSMLSVFQQQFIVIVREELKDDEVVKRVAQRLGQVALPRDGREADRAAQLGLGGTLPVPDA